MVKLATLQTPAGNIIELHEDDGRFTSHLYTPEEPRELSPEQAAELYRVALQLGGVQHRQFPTVEAVA